MKVNLDVVKVYQDLEHKKFEMTNAREGIAQSLYRSGQGLACHALSVKLWNARGEVELDDNEVKLIRSFVESIYAPCFIDAIHEVLGTGEEE